MMKKMCKVLAVTIMAAAVLGMAFYLRGSFSVAQCNDTEAMEARVIELGNLYRAQAGLAPLTRSDALSRAADVRVAECGVCFSHMRPDGSEWWTVEPDYAYGENLAIGYTNAEGAVDAWMGSPAHMYNIMSPSFTTCGVGVAIINGKLYYVAEYGY